MSGLQQGVNDVRGWLRAQAGGAHEQQRRANAHTPQLSARLYKAASQPSHTAKAKKLQTAARNDTTTEREPRNQPQATIRQQGKHGAALNLKQPSTPTLRQQRLQQHNFVGVCDSMTSWAMAGTPPARTAAQQLSGGGVIRSSGSNGRRGGECQGLGH